MREKRTGSSRLFSLCPSATRGRESVLSKENTSIGGYFSFSSPLGTISRHNTFLTSHSAQNRTKSGNVSPLNNNNNDRGKKMVIILECIFLNCASRSYFILKINLKANSRWHVNIRISSCESMNCLKSCESRSDKTNRTSFVQRR